MKCVCEGEEKEMVFYDTGIAKPQQSKQGGGRVN